MSRQMLGDVASKVFALLLYLALHQVGWRHDGTGEIWTCSWRGASDIIDRLRGESGFGIWYSMIYQQTLDFPFLDEEVVGKIAALGWTPIFDETGAK